MLHANIHIHIVNLSINKFFQNIWYHVFRYGLSLHIDNASVLMGVYASQPSFISKCNPNWRCDHMIMILSSKSIPQVDSCPESNEVHVHLSRMLT